MHVNLSKYYINDINVYGAAMDITGRLLYLTHGTGRRTFIDLRSMYLDAPYHFKKVEIHECNTPEWGLFSFRFNPNTKRLVGPIGAEDQPHVAELDPSTGKCTIMQVASCGKTDIMPPVTLDRASSTLYYYDLYCF
eukprot:TRINITY_DN13471_c0_g1_i1.p1 TRINITY_DN13471_c0_g1~~TRINITY_DN13471_c0_g1_i1.p1  ORF type:complete len:136 (+),score=10.76 TRINITY_DN13471_c0_g1_i1:338-745(+)